MLQSIVWLNIYVTNTITPLVIYIYIIYCYLGYYSTLWFSLMSCAHNDIIVMLTIEEFQKLRNGMDYFVCAYDRRYIYILLFHDEHLWTVISLFHFIIQLSTNISIYIWCMYLYVFVYLYYLVCVLLYIENCWIALPIHFDYCLNGPSDIVR